MALWNHWKTKREFARYKTHLSDKLELDSRNVQELNKERTRLAQENENLRVQVARLNERPDNKLQREVEILARAEKHMMMNAPGFAPAWEMAKSQAAASLQTEETGQSIPQRIFRKLLGTSSSGGAATSGGDASTAGKNADAGATAA
jgi:regulator of replication initiation timing